MELKIKEQLKREANQNYPEGKIVGNNSSMQKVSKLIQKAAIAQANILIQGETGTGKDLVARAIYRASDRSMKKYVTVNCGAIPETLLGSELFGYQKGAFTGASEDKIGLFEVADGGYLFLDEIGDLSLPLQVKILRILDTGELQKLGDTNDKVIDLRIIAASNRNLKEMVREGNFRRD